MRTEQELTELLSRLRRVSARVVRDGRAGKDITAVQKELTSLIAFIEWALGNAPEHSLQVVFELLKTHW